MNTTLPSQGMSCYPPDGGAAPGQAAGAPHLPRTGTLLEAALAAKPALAALSTEEKKAVLLSMADALEANAPAILAANAQDLEAAQGTIAPVMQGRIADMAAGVRAVAALPDPVGRTLASHTLPNGLQVNKVSVPLGVIAIIYESRPNVTSDAASLTFQAGSVCVLRGGKESIHSNTAIVDALHQALEKHHLPAALVSLVTDTTRDSANELMRAVGYVDLLIPRGGASLIQSCVDNAKVPCIQTGTGICHLYVDADADLDKALTIVDNAKTSRPSVCNAAEVCLVHRDIAPAFPSCGTGWWTAAGPPASRRWNSSWTRRPWPSWGRDPLPGRRTSTRSFWTTSWPSGWWAAWRRPSTTSTATPPATARPSSPRPGPTRTCSPNWWTAPPSTSTPPPGSPTGASSAWGVRWASPPRSSTPGAPWGWRSSPATSTSSWETGRSGKPFCPWTQQRPQAEVRLGGVGC